MRRAPFDLLRSFLAVSRSGAVSRAVDLPALAQPTVTAHVKASEGEMGRPLFSRVAHGAWSAAPPPGPAAGA